MMINLATKYRPKTFGDVVGQSVPVEILRRIVSGQWHPPSVVFGGPYGTGKTTLARIMAREILCESPNGPGNGWFEKTACGKCDSCLQMDGDSHPLYMEMDAASHGSVKDTRELKNMLQYQAGGRRIITFDESHMLSQEAQDALLKLIEEGTTNSLIAFCTTEMRKMAKTIISRSVVLNLRLLSGSEIAARLRVICAQEGIKADDPSLRLIAFSVRGHMRDAIQVLGQMSQIGGNDVTPDLVKAYLKLDKVQDIYRLLCLKTDAERFSALEDLLCTVSVPDLQEMLGQTLLNAYKVVLGAGEFSEVDKAWLGKVLENNGRLNVLTMADNVLSQDLELASLERAQAAFSRLLVIRESTSAAPPTYSNPLRKEGK